MNSFRSSLDELCSPVTELDVSRSSLDELYSPMTELDVSRSTELYHPGNVMQLD